MAQTEVVAQTTAKSPMACFKDMLNAQSVQEQIQNAMGENKASFVASLIEVFGSNASLQKCKPAEIIKQALRAAVMKLPLTSALGMAYLVVYNNKVKQNDGSWQTVPTPTFIPGYKGLIQLALRSGKYKHINAGVIYEGECKSKDKLTGLLDLSGMKKSDKVEGYFAYIELQNGFKASFDMTLDDMAKFAKARSKSIPKEVTIDTLKQSAQNGESNGKVGWLGNFESMAKKTCLRHLISTYGLLSIEMQEVLSNEAKAESEQVDPVPQKEEVTFDTEYEEVTPQQQPPQESQVQQSEDLPNFAK